MTTQVFESYDAFEAREDKRINGVSKWFAERYPNWASMNETNLGCWNCADCERCWGCADCRDCVICVVCERCERCENCRNCTNCMNCTNCGVCERCERCVDCWGAEDCVGNENKIAGE